MSYSASCTLCMSHSFHGDIDDITHRNAEIILASAISHCTSSSAAELFKVPLKFYNGVLEMS